LRHLFVQCPYLAAVWALAALGLRLPPTAGLTILVDRLAEHLPEMQSSPRNTVVLSILWAV
jgi:lysyl-tRNA synthetase class II